MKSVIITGIAALALSLTGGHAGLAETTDQASPAAEAKYNWTFRGDYIDSLTERSYYQAYHYDAKSGFMGRVIYKDKQGEWHALPDRYLDTEWYSSTEQPTLADSKDIPGIQRLSYDPSTDAVVRQVVFDKTGNQSFGLLQIKTPALPRKMNGYVMATAHSLLLLKNDNNGEIHLIGDSEHSFFTRWLDGGSLLVEGYSEDAKQNEIVKIDPATGKSVRLLLASLYDYDEAGQKLLIAYNEPTRRQWIYSLKDGTVHPASTLEIDSFYDSPTEPSTSSSRPQEPADQPPSDLQPQLLPISPTMDTTVNEAEITVGGTNVKLPFAFQSGETTFLPIRPLVDAYLCTVEQTKSAGSSSFTLIGPSGRLKIQDEDSTMLGYRLYVTTEQLKSIGLMTEQLNWIHPD